MHDDSLSLLPRTDFTRREFVVTSLAVGFALAAQPVSADTITTDTKGLEAGEVKIPVPDGEIPAYRALPAEGEKHPVILVVQEIFGVHEHIKDICRRLAKLGYYAVAPELYARQGDVSKLTKIQEEIIPIVIEGPRRPGHVRSRCRRGLRQKSGKADTAKLGITGFCWGGRIVWLYSAHNPKVKAGVAWYGRLVGQADDLHPKHPVDVAASIKAPILGLYGGADQGIPVISIDRMRGALKDAGKTAEIIVYPDTPHAFFADYRQSYRKEQAEDGWKRMLEWFKKNGVA